MLKTSLFRTIQKYQHPATIFFRGVELSLLNRQFKKYLNQKRILDFGCGEGFSAQAVFSHRITYGLDNDDKAVTLAKKSEIYQKVLFSNSQPIPLTNHSVDLIFSNCVFEHISNLSEILTEIHRILNHHGLLIFTAPTDQFTHYSIFSLFRLSPFAKFYGWLRNKKYQHYHCYSLKDWSSLLKKNGFQIIDHFYYMNRQELEFWDFLLFFHWPYRQFFRNIIRHKIITAQIANNRAAAIAIVAQKNA